jgi:hypothetical protein
VDRGLAVVLTMMAGAALALVEACTGGDERPPFTTELGYSPPGTPIGSPGADHGGASPPGSEGDGETGGGGAGVGAPGGGADIGGQQPGVPQDGGATGTGTANETGQGTPDGTTFEINGL